MMLSSRSPLSYLFFMLLALSMSPLVFTTANRIPRNKEHVPANTQDHVPRQLYRQTSREAIVMREEKRSRQRSGATRTGPEKRQTSQMAFPTSTDPSYTSTGFTPWAMYRNTDANGSSFRRVDGVNTREACHVLCQGDAACIGDTYSANLRICFILYSLLAPPNAYKAQDGGGFLWSKRGVSCEQDAANALSSSTCYTQYRAS